MKKEKNLETKKNNQRFKAYLKTDKAKLMICISLAFVFWLFTKLSKDYNSYINLEIEYKPQKGWTFMDSPQPNQVLFELKGSGWTLLKGHLFGFPKRLEITLEDRAKSTVSGAALRTKLESSLENDVEVLTSSEDAILIELDSSEYKKVPVVYQSELRLKEGFQIIDQIRFEPDSILVFGPKTLISKFEKYNTLTYQKEDIHQNIDEPIALERPKKSAIELSHDFVQLKCKIEPYTQKTIELPIEVINGKDSIYLNTLSVKVIGNISSKSLDAEALQDIKAVVDFKSEANLNNQEHLIVDIKNIPKFMTNIRYYPQSVRYYVVK